MPMQGCDDCIVNSIKYLMSIEDSKLRDKITLIFVGELRKNHYRISSQDVQKLKEIYKFVDDKMQDIFKYQTGFAYPLFVHLKNGKIKSYKEMTYDKFPTVFDKIRKSN
jgi:hypothetical protein